LNLHKKYDIIFIETIREEIKNMGYYILSLNIPKECYARYRSYIDYYRTCRHITSKKYDDVMYIQISFRSIAEDKFIEKILQYIDEICCGDAEVLSFFKTEIDTFAF
jgi:hypothetical protein